MIHARHLPFRSRLPLVLAACLTLCLVASPSRSQVIEKKWQKLLDFRGTVRTVYFLDLPGPPRIGFVSTPDLLLRTTDGGEHWDTCFVGSSPFLASDFAFKDSLTGWFSNWIDDASVSGCFKTTDGGKTWSALATPAAYCAGVYYNRAHDLLLLAGWAPKMLPANSAFSTDGGATWKVFRTRQDLNGFAFISADTGIVTGKSQNFLRTTDGGFTWTPVNEGGDETWQPVADTITRQIWASSEAFRTLLRSRNEGLNFPAISVNLPVGFRSQLGSTTGTLRLGACGTLYAQFTKGSSYQALGMIRSVDGGDSWQSIADGTGSTGPVNVEDTRFYVRGGYIFAGSTDTLTGASSLYRYVEDSTQYNGGTATQPFATTKDFHIESSACGKLSTALHVLFLNDCIVAELVFAEITPSSRFTLALKDPLPHRLNGNYPIPIVYSPIDHSNDTATLTLTYRVNGETKTEVILLSGNVPGTRLFARFDVTVNGAKTSHVRAGEDAVVSIQLLDDIPDAVGLDSVAFQTSFLPDVLSFDHLDVNTPWSILRESHTAGVQELVVRRLAGIDLAANSEIARITYHGMIAIEPSTQYRIDSVRLNDADSIFDACTATTARPEPLSISIGGEECGDSTLRAYMAGVPAIELVAAYGIPSHGIELEVQSRIESMAEVTLYDMKGTLLMAPLNAKLFPGSQHLTLPPHISEGIYFVRIHVTEGLAKGVSVVRRLSLIE